jgi:hypothetical protein
LWSFMLTGALVAAESAPPADTTVQMVVTIENSDIQNTLPPTMTDIVVTQNSVVRPITKLIPLSGDNAPIEMFVLIDDCSNFEPGSRSGEFRSFLLTQPSSTLIGSAYIRGGHVEVLQTQTPDRDQLINSLIPPRGCQPASPFVALGELIKEWKRTNSRRVVVLISGGIDPDIREGYSSASVEAAIEAAQCAGVIVYVMYHPGAHYEVTSYKTAYSGQVLLAHLANETGGQAYFSGLGPEPSITPYLAAIGRQLANQYSVVFIADQGEGGRLHSVTVRTSNPRFDITAPYKIWMRK